MKNYFLLLLVIISSIMSPLRAMEWEDSSPKGIERVFALAMQQKPIDFHDVNFNVGKKFHRKDETNEVYIKCIDEQYDKNRRLSSRSFSINAEKAQVGAIIVSYRPRKKDVQIRYMNIFSPYRRKGYGEFSLRKVIEIYRSPSHNHLEFDNFVLSTFKTDDFIPARALYKKVGFEVSKEGPLSYKMSLKR